MPVTSDGQNRSVTSLARRSQIMAAAVEVIALEGFAQASFARIAEQAGLSSTRLISYHFAGKGELIAAVADEVFTALGQQLAARMAPERDPGELLRAYIEGSVEFAGAHGEQMKALLEILGATGLRYDEAADPAVVPVLEDILRRGQDSGSFRAFDVRVMAMAVQRTLEGVAYSATGPEGPGYARELVALFELATRRAPG